MKLPSSNKTLVPRDKLLNYVLSETHATGKFKARFFRKLGFNKTNIVLFEKFLLKIAKSERVIDEVVTPYGTKYILECTYYV